MGKVAFVGEKFVTIGDLDVYNIAVQSELHYALMEEGVNFCWSGSYVMVEPACSS